MAECVSTQFVMAGSGHMVGHLNLMVRQFNLYQPKSVSQKEYSAKESEFASKPSSSVLSFSLCCLSEGHTSASVVADTLGLVGSAESRAQGH